MGGQTKTLRLGYGAYYTLAQWGLEVDGVRSIPVLAWAAASCGAFDAAGNWHSDKWASPVDLADALINDEELNQLLPAVDQMLEVKKRLTENPGAERAIVASPPPATLQ